MMGPRQIEQGVLFYTSRSMRSAGGSFAEVDRPLCRAVGLAAKRMIERSLDRFDLYPARLLGDSAYGSAEMLGWLVYKHGIEPHVTVFDKSTRQDGTFSRDDFTYDHVGDVWNPLPRRQDANHDRPFTGG